jgi:hypothetical protein
MASIKKLCKKAKDNWKKVSFNEMIRLAEYFGAEVEPKEGSIYNIYYPSDLRSPVIQLHKPHGSRSDVPLDYKKKFINIFADAIDEEVA